jgi:DNA polymerase IV
MHELGIHTGADLKHWSEIDLVKRFGKTGHFYYQIARGIDERPVNPNRIRKSIGAETSFDPDLEEIGRVEQELNAIAQVVQQRLERNGAKGRTITLKVKFADYQQITRSRTMLDFIDGESQVSSLAQELLRGIGIEQQKVRLLGITLSNLDSETEAPSYKQLVLDLQPFSGPMSRSSYADWI